MLIAGSTMTCTPYIGGARDRRNTVAFRVDVERLYRGSPYDRHRDETWRYFLSSVPRAVQPFHYVGRQRMSVQRTGRTMSQKLNVVLRKQTYLFVDQSLGVRP